MLFNFKYFYADLTSIIVLIYLIGSRLCSYSLALDLYAQLAAHDLHQLHQWGSAAANLVVDWSQLSRNVS